jgi:hypothetical protein
MKTSERNEAGYSEGGARGEVARGRAEKSVAETATTSSRFTIGVIGMLEACGAITEPAVEQSGQMCEPVAVEVTSAQ